MTGQLFTVPAKLKGNQEALWQAISAFTEPQTWTAAEAGHYLHWINECEWCKPNAACQFAERQGRQVLEALRKKGLLKRDRHHIYRRTDTPPAPISPVLSPEDEFGY
jgi:hypothetical protein